MCELRFWDYSRLNIYILFAVFDRFFGVGDGGVRDREETCGLWAVMCEGEAVAAQWCCGRCCHWH